MSITKLKNIFPYIKLVIISALFMVCRYSSHQNIIIKYIDLDSKQPQEYENISRIIKTMYEINNDKYMSHFEKNLFKPIYIFNNSKDTIVFQSTDNGLIQSRRTEYYYSKNDSLYVHDSEWPERIGNKLYKLGPQQGNCFIIYMGFHHSERVNIVYVEFAYPFNRKAKASKGEFLITKLKVKGEYILYDKPYETYIMDQKDYEKKVYGLARILPNK